MLPAPLEAGKNPPTSIESWLGNMDPYNGVFLNNPHITG